MARIDSLLRLVLQQGADELRLGVEREPKMFARGTAKRLSVPATSEETLRILLGEILSPEVEAELRAQGGLETTYEAAGLGAFRVKFSNGQTARFDVAFVHSIVVTAEAEAEKKAAALIGPTTAGPTPTKGTLPRAPAANGTPDAQPPAPKPSARRATLPHASGLTAAAAPEPQLDVPDSHQVLEPQPPAARTARIHLPPLAAEALRPSAPPTPRESLPPLPAARLSQPPPVQPAGALTEWAHRAAALGASDLHLLEGEPPRLRVHGRLQHFDAPPPQDLLRLLDLPAESRAHLERGESLDLGLDIAELGRLRAHVYRTDSGLAAALRLLPAAAPSFKQLNMPLAFDDLIDLPHGLVLVCGAAGAGKSTTLAALAQQLLEKRSVLMVTLEDPIEYLLTPGPQSLVRRRQIGRDVPDFPSGLRDALRADPEVLLVGEMRDPESISLALTAAETGHLVLASMHSGSSISAIERIVDAYPAAGKDAVRAQLAESLRAVIVQRLLPRARGVGRLPAVEVLRVTRAVASLMREGKTAQLPTVLQSSRRDGMLSLERSLADRVLSGEVKLEAAVAAANDPDTLQHYLDQRSA